MAVGYSGTPLPKKLGIKPGHVVGIFKAPEGFAEGLGGLPMGVRLWSDPRANIELDVAIAFVTDEGVLRRRFPAWAKRIAKNGGLWISWPKKSSALATQLRDSHVRTIGLQAGLVDNKVCAIDQDWSGLRFVYRVGDR